MKWEIGNELCMYPRGSRCIVGDECRFRAGHFEGGGGAENHECEGCGVVTSMKDESPDHYFMVALQKAEGTSEVRIENFNAHVKVGAWINVYHVRVGTMVHPRIVAISEGECKAQSK
jgi:hypothetical protein